MIASGDLRVILLKDQLIDAILDFKVIFFERF